MPSESYSIPSPLPDTFEGTSSSPSPLPQKRQRKHLSLIPLLKSLLLLPRVPPQLPTNTIDPLLAPAARRLHARKRVPARADGHVVARLQLRPLAAVEAGPAARARAVRHADAQHDGVGQDDGPERQRVRADGRHQHDGVLRVAQRAARREVVGRRARRRRDADAVGQDRGEVLVVAKDLGVGHC